MIGVYWDSFCCWLTSVGNIFMNAWHHLTPTQYGGMLIGIGVFGWVLMKGTSKNP